MRWGEERYGLVEDHDSRDRIKGDQKHPEGDTPGSRNDFIILLGRCNRAEALKATAKYAKYRFDLDLAIQDPDVLGLDEYLNSLATDFRGVLRRIYLRVAGLKEADLHALTQWSTLFCKGGGLYRGKELAGDCDLRKYLLKEMDLWKTPFENDFENSSHGALNKKSLDLRFEFSEVSNEEERKEAQNLLCGLWYLGERLGSCGFGDWDEEEVQERVRRGMHGQGRPACYKRVRRAVPKCRLSTKGEMNDVFGYADF